MYLQFFGKRGDAFFDAWTLVHLAFWFMVGANMEQLQWPHWVRWSAVGIGAVSWEFFETWLDLKTDLEMTKESFANRWLSDPLMAFVGSFLGMLAIGT
jgi:hypothetical protein